MTRPQQLDRCWFTPKEPVCVCQLGRFGDLLQLFPAFKLLGNPVVMVSDEYASVFDGISYVKPWVVPYRWWNDTAKAKRRALDHFSKVIVPQYWNDVDGVPETESKTTKLRFKAHGRTWAVEGETSDYGTCMWNRLGFTRAQMLSEPLVIDRRDKDREQALVKAHVRPGKPVVLYNFTGVCSPFGYVPEMMRLFKDYQSALQLIDLGKIRATRIYDLLGLYDIAVGIISSDTSTLHLCPGSKTASMLFTVDGTGESVPRGNCQFSCSYSQVPKSMPAIRSTLQKWIDESKAA